MIKKIFIKNYKDVDDINVRNSYARVAGIFGIITNFILGIIKIILGIISHSISIMADAVNNLTDMISSILTIIGFKLSLKKADEHHPYGHARYEYIFGLVISLFMLVMGILFAKEGISKIIRPVDLIINKYTFIIIIFSILLKVFQMILYSDFAKCINSKTLKSSSVDTRNDIISTSTILISMIIMYKYDINIDGIVSIIVSLFVIYSSIKMIIEVMQPLVGVKPNKQFVKQIRKRILSYDNVLGVHDIVIHNYGVSNDYIIAHVELDSKMSLLKAHNIVDEIENDFKKDNLKLTIHIDPVVRGNKKIDKVRDNINKLLKQLNKNISIHDFRMIEGSKNTKIIFDCVIPYDYKISKYKIIKYLKNNMENGKTYSFIIEIDRPY